MARFKPNQEVVCVSKKNQWFNLDEKKLVFYGPSKDELVHVDHYSPRHGGEFCCFVEYADLDKDGLKHYFNERNFEPVISDAAIAELFQQEPAIA